MPIIKLLKKKNDFNWNDRCEESLREIKKNLTTALILMLHKVEETYTIFIDTLREGYGSILIQENNMIAYTSR